MITRATIEQAKGISICQSAVIPEVAFEMLRDASPRENRKIRAIAQELVDRAMARRAVNLTKS
jgi:AmiR/NasT family two-component response regulator